MPGGGLVSTHEDITERQRAEARIAHMAHHDVLTDLPNRALLRERLEQATAAMRQGGRRLAVLMLASTGSRRSTTRWVMASAMRC
jgi:GGDEF domain-containing protein